MSNDQPKVACEYGAMGRHTWQRTADNTDICINCKRYRSVVPPTSAPKVEPVADSPDSNCPCKSENEDLHGQSASATDVGDVDVALTVAGLNALGAVIDRAGGTFGYGVRKAAALIERLAARLRRSEDDNEALKLSLQYSETNLAAANKGRDKAVRMFKAAVAGQAIGWAEVSTKGAP